MTINRKTVAIAATVAALGAASAGAVYGLGGDSEERVSGPDADKAAGAALNATGGGSVTEVEYQDSGGAGLYEVEIMRDDGSQVEVHLDGKFQPVGTAADDDAGGDNEDGPGDDD